MLRCADSGAHPRILAEAGKTALERRSALFARPRHTLEQRILRLRGANLLAERSGALPLRARGLGTGFLGLLLIDIEAQRAAQRIDPKGEKGVRLAPLGIPGNHLD